MIYVFPLLVLALIIFLVCKDRHDTGFRDDRDAIMVCIGLLVCFFLIFMMIILVWTGSNGASQRRLQAFYDTNSNNYAIVVSKTQAILSEEKFSSQLIAGSVEKIEQGKMVSERLKEWRDSINDYNYTVAGMQYWKSNIFTGVMVPNEVNNMKFLKIE